MEGTSNPSGAIWASNLLRRVDDGWRKEALVFFTNFHHGFDPADFQTILPKNYIHHMVPGDPVHTFFADWKAACAETSPLQTWGLRHWYSASAHALARRGYRINLQRRWLSRGWMIWHDPA